MPPAIPLAAIPLANGPVIENYPSIDDILGDGSHRFFGHGYRNTHPKLHDLRVTHTPGESTLTATASLGVQGSWSVKGTSHQTPHLGTTDVMVLACRMAEALLASRYAPGLLHNAYVRSVTVSGGNQPVEGTLDNLDCRASLHVDDGGTSSILRCTIASLSAELEVAHGPSEPGLASVQSPSEDALVGEAGMRLYGDLWSRRQVSLLNVQLDPEGGTAAALASFRLLPSPEDGADERLGLEAAYPNALSAVEYFVAALQLGQVLLYRLDAMDRASSNTLWMRKTRVSLRQAGPAATDCVRGGSSVEVRLRRSRLVTMEGSTWRCADIVGTFDGADVVCSVAHRVPAGHAAGGSR